MSKEINKKPSILIVEDSPFFQKAIKAELENEELNITFQANGNEAIKIFEENTFDLILLDLELPEKNGFEVFEDINKITEDNNRKEIPVVFLTSNDTIENRRKGFELGAIDFLSKSNLAGNLSIVLNNILHPGKTYSSMNVLILDDSKVVRTIMKNILNEEGIKTHEASSAKEAYEILNDNIPINMIIVDKELPGVDGLDFVKGIRQHYSIRQVPILVVSGHPVKDVTIDFFNAGASDYLSKPFIKEEFWARVRTKLDTYLMDKVLRDSSNRNKELNEFQDKFFAQCSHDMKNPLTVILSAVNLIKNEDNLSEKQLGHLKKIKTSSTNLLSLITNLLDLRKVELNSTYLLKKIGIKSIISETVTELQLIGMKKNINIDLELPERDCFIQGDELAIHRVFSNLLSNAVKFSKEGDRIEVKGAIIKNNLFISVIDNGIGMPKEQQEQLFSDEHMSTRTGTSGERGTGLGISICKSICLKHNAEISVDSTEGEGTTFLTKWNLVVD